MTNFLGFLLPPFIDMINSKIADSKQRFWVSVTACTLVAALLVWGQTDLSSLTPYAIFELIAGESLVVFGMAQLSYKAIWEKSDVRESLSLKASDEKDN